MQNIPTSMYVMNNTREKILDSVFQDMLVHGFQGLRTDKVIRDMEVTKGALYHYFPNKLSIGYSIVEEILTPMYLSTWQRLATFEGNPVPYIKECLQTLKVRYSEENVVIGCPLNNLIQEMSPIDEGFRVRLEKIVNGMQRLIAGALRQGQTAGHIRQQVQAEQVAYFILAGIEGSYSMAKVKKNSQVFHDNINHLKAYLDTLVVRD